MNCKPGDMAVVVAPGLDPLCPPRVGAIVVVDCLCDVFPDSWITSPPIIDPRDGRLVSIRDCILRPIRDPGDDATDETLGWLPVPGKAVTA